MLIRTRVLLITLAFSITIIAALIFDRIQHEQMVAGQFAEAVLNDRTTLWRKLVENIVQRMEDKAWIITENEALPSLLTNRNLAGLAQTGGKLFERIRELNIATRLDIADRNGDLSYSSSLSLLQSPIVNEQEIKRMLDGGARGRGIGNDAARQVAIVLTVGINRLPGERVGAAALATDIDVALAEMKASIDADVLFVNRRARELAGTAEGLWQQLSNEGSIELDRSVQTVNLDETVYNLTMIPVKASLGNLVGWLVMAKDITPEARQREQLTLVSILVVGAFLVLALLTLSFYLRHSLAPLSSAVGVLDLLAKGDTTAHLDIEDRQDEVGQIGAAINRLRKELMAFERLRRSREKQRWRQERFIRREMMDLADTLDEKERLEVISELTEIEAQADKQQDPAQQGTVGQQGLAMMAFAFEKMSSRVQAQQTRMTGLILQLREALETKTAYLALQKELEIARRVQLAALPKALPPSDRLELDGRMIPAKEVGGDFYDFFELTGGRLGIAIADVSGKGVPAALFMAISRTLLRATAQRFDSPGACLSRLNNLLVQNNDEELFVTVFYAIYHPASGRFDYANGGHNPPISVNSGNASSLALTGGMALGVLEDISYRDASVTLGPGDVIIHYTDGVTEAFDKAGNEYGMERLLSQARAEAGRSANEIIDMLLADIDAFAKDEPQADDITCVVLRHLGSKSVGGPIGTNGDMHDMQRENAG